MKKHLAFSKILLNYKQAFLFTFSQDTVCGSILRPLFVALGLEKYSFFPVDDLLAPFKSSYLNCRLAEMPSLS